MYTDLLMILLPLFAGYLVVLPHPSLLLLLQRFLNILIYLILLCMGIGLAFLPNLSTNLLLVLTYTTVTLLSILTVSLISLLILEWYAPWPSKHHAKTPSSRLHMVFDSIKLCSVVLAGFLLGLTEWPWLHYASKGSQVALMLLLALVGIQLRNSGISLRQLALNRRGLLVTAVTGSSALVGGAVAALFLGLPIKTGLALASGYGWYSLSGIVMTEYFGPVIGSTAFFNDLGRELFAIMLIPALARRGRNVALGLAGCTSMDFTLPILQRSAGLEMVPAAIVHGFLLSLIAPVLMGLFAA